MKLKKLSILMILVLAFSLFSACESDDEKISASIYISCAQILVTQNEVDNATMAIVPTDGIILQKTEFLVSVNTSALDMLKEVAKHYKIPLSQGFGYVRSIGGIAEKKGGELSGWIIFVNGEFLSVGSGSYYVKQGDEIQWHYSCSAGDVSWLE